MSRQLKITKGGRLIRTTEKYDQYIDDHVKTVDDVTDIAYRFLFDHCDLDESVTLKDVFLLLNSNIDMFDLILGNWCKEFVNEGLNGQPTNNKKDLNDIDCLELYWSLTINKEWEPYPDGPREPEKGSFTEQMGMKDEGDFTGKKGLFGYNFPQFHGIGLCTVEEYGYKVGDTINWGISYCNAADLIDLPLKLNKKLMISEDFIEKKIHKLEYKKEEFEDCEYTLGHILYGIIWELSWNGDPSKRDLKKQELDEIVKDIKENGIEGDEVLESEER